MELETVSCFLKASECFFESVGFVKGLDNYKSGKSITSP